MTDSVSETIGDHQGGAIERTQMSKLGVAPETRLYLLGRGACCSFLAARLTGAHTSKSSRQPHRRLRHTTTPPTTLSFVVWPHIIGLKTGDELAVRAQGAHLCCLFSS